MSRFQVASCYITDPVLFRRPEIGLVKFDIRYVIILKSVQSFEAYVYNVFWLRFANKCVCAESVHLHGQVFRVRGKLLNIVEHGLLHIGFCVLLFRG